MSQMTWRCSNCTVINEEPGKRCKCCGAVRPVDSLEGLFALQSLINWQCSKCNSVNSANKASCGKCHAIGTWSTEDQYQDRLLPEAAGLAQANCNECNEQTQDSGTCSFKTEEGSSQHNPASFTDIPDDPELDARSADEKPELRIVLIGRTGEGKSATGNTILDEDIFESSLASVSVTKGCQRGTCTRFERYIQVIDTPGMYDTEMSIPDITSEVIKCVGMTAPGPHVFLLVIKPDRFTEEVQNTIDHFFKIFGEGMLNHLIIVFTKKDELLYNGKTIDDYLRRGSDKLKSLLQSCNNRYLTFNNRGTAEEKEEDVKNLLHQIDEVVQENKGVYTSEMFQQAENIMKEKEDMLRREHEEKIDRETKQIREQCNLQLRAVEDNYADITRQLQRRLHDLEHQQTKDSSNEDLELLKKLLEDTKVQQRKELGQLRKSANSKVHRLKNQKINFREKAREELSKGAKFMKEILLPGLFKVAKTVLPILLTVGISVLVKLL